MRLIQLVESLEQHVVGLTETVRTTPDARTVSEDVAEHTDRLTRRLDLLEQRMEEDRARDDEARRNAGERLVERLRVELDAVRAERDHTVAQATGGLRDALEGLERRLVEASQGSDELVAVHAAVDDLTDRVETVQQSLSVQAAEVPATLEQELVPLRAVLRDIDGRTAGLAEQIAARGLADVEDLRRPLDDLGDRLEALDASVSARIHEVSAQFERGLEPLGAALGEDVRSWLAGIEQRSEGATEQLSTAVRAIRETLASTDARLSNGLDEVRGAVEQLGATADDVPRQIGEELTLIREEQRRLLSEVGDGLREAQSRTLDVLADRLADQLEELRSLGDGLGVDLTAQLEPLRSALTARLEEEGEAIRAALVGRLGATEDQLGERVTAVLAERTDDLRRALDAETEHVAALLEATESSTDTVLARQREDREAILAALTEERTALVDDLSGLRDELSAAVRSLHEAGDAGAGRVGELADLVRSLVERGEESAGRSERIAADVRSLIEAGEESAGRSERMAADVRSLIEAREEDAERASELGRQVGARLDAAIERLEAIARASSDRVVEQVGSTLGEMRIAVAGTRDAIGALTERHGEDADRLDALRDELIDGLEEQLRTVRQSVQNGLASNRETVDRAMDVVKASVDSRMTVFEERADSLRTELATRLEGAERGITDLAGRVESFGERVDEKLDAAATRLETDSAERARETSAAIRARLTELTAEVERRLVELNGALDERLPATLARHRTEVSEVVAAEIERASASLDEVGARLGAVAEQLQSASVDLEARIEAGLDRAVETAETEATRATRSLRRATSRLEDLFAGISDLEIALTDYLEARDARLEQERAEVLRDLVEEFAEGLSRRERKKLGRRLDRARENVAPGPAPLLRPEDGADGSTSPDPSPSSGEHRPGALADLVQPPAATTGDAGSVEAEPDAQPEAPPAAEGEGEPAPRHLCPECGFEAKNAGGLASHRRRHA